MRATSLFVVALVFLALLATPALAGPDEGGKRRPPETKDLQKQIQKLTKELKGLEKRLEKARAARPGAEKAEKAAAGDRRALAEQQRRMADARRRLAGLLADRGPTDRRQGAPQPPRGERRRRGKAPDAPKGAEWMGALRRLHEQNRRLTARVETLERHIKRVGAALGKRAPGPGGHDGPRARPEHAKKGPGGPPSVEARLERIERAVRALMAQGRRGNARHGWARGPEGRRAGRARQSRGQAQGRGGRGMRGDRGRGRQAGCAHGDGPRWSRMLRGDRMHRSPTHGPDRPARGRRASGRQGGRMGQGDRMGQGAMQRGRGQHAGSCPFCGS